MKRITLNIQISNIGPGYFIQLFIYGYLLVWAELPVPIAFRVGGACQIIDIQHRGL